MKAKREQDEEEMPVIKLFVSNYAIDLICKYTKNSTINIERIITINQNYYMKVLQK